MVNKKQIGLLMILMGAQVLVASGGLLQGATRVFGPNTTAGAADGQGSAESYQSPLPADGFFGEGSDGLGVNGQSESASAPLPPPAFPPAQRPQGATGKLIRDHEKYWIEIVNMVMHALTLNPSKRSKNIKDIHTNHMKDDKVFGAFINNPTDLHSLIAHLIVHIVPHDDLLRMVSMKSLGESYELNALLVWNIWAARIAHEVDLFTPDVTRTQGSRPNTQSPKDEKFTEQEIKQLYPLFKKLCELVLGLGSTTTVQDLIKGMKEAIKHYNRLNDTERMRLGHIAMIIMLYEQAIIQYKDGPTKLWEMLNETWNLNNGVAHMSMAFRADAEKLANSLPESEKKQIMQDSNNFIKYVQENILKKNKFAGLIETKADLDKMSTELDTFKNLMGALNQASTPTNRTGYKRLALLIGRYLEYSKYFIGYTSAAGYPAASLMDPSASSLPITRLGGGSVFRSDDQDRIAQGKSITEPGPSDGPSPAGRLPDVELQTRQPDGTFGPAMPEIKIPELR